MAADIGLGVTAVGVVADTIFAIVAGLSRERDQGGRGDLADDTDVQLRLGVCRP